MGAGAEYGAETTLLGRERASFSPWSVPLTDGVVWLVTAASTVAGRLVQGTVAAIPADGVRS